MSGSSSALRDRVVQAVLVFAVLAVVARLVGLGGRVAHQDEARVGYWTLRFLESGRYEYRPIVHGPFIPVVVRHLFGTIGPSDFAARLPMALLGGTMPATALLFRSRLRDSEVVAFAALLAANPVLLYYSRFMRQDVPLAALALLTLGLAVRAIDTGGRSRRRYVYAAGLVFGLAATTKENVLLYPVAWAGALFLLVDHRLLVGEAPVATARSMVPAPPRPAVSLPSEVRLVAPLAFLGTVPAVAAVAGLEGTALVGLLTVSGLAFYGSVRGATVWHLLGGLPLLALAALGLVRPGFDPGLTTFAAGLAWLLAALLLADERLFAYGQPVATDGGSPADGAGGGERGDETDDGSPADETDDGAGHDPTGTREEVPASTEDETPPAAGGTTSRASDEEATPDDGRPSAPATGGRSTTRRGERGALRFRPLPPLAVAYGLFLAVFVLFYAPRGGGYPEIGADLGGWGLWSALAAGSLDGLGLVLEETLYGTWTDFLRQWAGGAQDHAYIPFFLDFGKTLGAGALTVTLASVAGTLYDRYLGGPREFVAFCAYWGFASVLGYPLVTDIPAPWTTVHAIVPLAVPAAVALAAVARIALEEIAADGASAGEAAGGSPDLLTVGAAVLVLLAAGGQVGVAAVDGVYQNPTDRNNELVQYAQPASPEMKSVLADIRSVAARNDGVDVLYYGDKFYSPNESDHDQPPAGKGWFDRFPLGYYTELYSAQGVDVTVDSTNRQRNVSLSDAPVVVAMADNDAGTVSYAASSIEGFLGNYSRYDGDRFLYNSGIRSSIVYFVDTREIESPAPVYASASPDAGMRLAPA